MTEQELVENIRRNIQTQGSAKLPAMEIFNLFEPKLNASWEFEDTLIAFANHHGWDIYPIGEVPFGELIFYPKGQVPRY